MVNPGDAFPPGDDWVVRQLKKLQDQINWNASARSLAASQIGSGGLLINEGGSLTIEGTGSLNVGSGALNSAGSISAATNITAGGTVAGGTVTSSGDVDATGNVNVGGITTSNAGLWSTSAYNDVLSTSWHNAFVRSDGKFGYVPSSRRFKQDEAPATLDLASVAALQLVTFRYIAAVEELGDNAAVEVGLIAEEVDALGLTWLVDYDSDGKPLGVKFDRLALALLPLVQNIEARLTALERASKP